MIIKTVLSALVLISGLLCSGCITHRAEVVIDEADADLLPGDPGRLVVADIGTASQSWSGRSSRSSAQPQELPLSLWLRDPDGSLRYGRAVAQTDRPWWQRFPADFVTDLWPQEFVVHNTVTVSPQPILPLKRAELDAAANAYGYGDMPPESE